MTAHSADGSALRPAREALGLSREALGAAAGGISSATIARIECGSVRPHRSTKAALARALGRKVEDIFPTTSETPTGTTGDLAKLDDCGVDRGTG